MRSRGPTSENLILADNIGISKQGFYFIATVGVFITVGLFINKDKMENTRM